MLPVFKIPGKYNFPVLKIVFLKKNHTMIWKEIKIAYRSYGNAEELPDGYKTLIDRARDSSEQAWAPYSQFRVGAAVRLKSGMILTGNNQENAAYPAGLCAERTALFYANANFPGDPVMAIAVTAQNARGLLAEPVKPCGGCRQAMLETESRYNQPITIILEGKDSIYVLDGVTSLLPLSFNRNSL
jgi:cytidine deaminase